MEELYPPLFEIFFNQPIRIVAISIGKNVCIYKYIHCLSQVSLSAGFFLGGGRGGHSPPLEDFVPPLEHLK